MTRIWSHRGYADGPGTEVENTVPAFLAASGTGVEGIELDVWLTADGAWVVHHDRQVAAGNLDELRRREVPPGVPSLEEALASCRVEVVNVELKVPRGLCRSRGWDLGRALARELCQCQPAQSRRFVVSSFCREALEAVRVTGIGLRVGLLVSGPLPGGLAGELGRRGYWGLHVEHPALDADEVSRAHEAGLSVVAWTVDEPVEMARLVTASVDVLITNFPRLALGAVPAER